MAVHRNNSISSDAGATVCTGTKLRVPTQLVYDLLTATQFLRWEISRANQIYQLLSMCEYLDQLCGGE